MSNCRDCACGCCSGIHAETPVLITNRPGLSAIAYRTGTHATWKHSMLAALSGEGNALSGVLTTREDDDFSIALLDAWATVADVLTFYQERIANESYIRTARERLSLVELARLIGYEPAPAVSAETRLAFTIDGEATKEIVIVDAGTRVQSVPGQNETPQTFETATALQARAEWNAMKVRPVINAHIAETNTWVAGTDTNLRRGDALLFTAGTSFEVRRVSGVFPDFDNKRTHLTWDVALTIITTTVSAMRVAAPLFGSNGPQPGVLPPGVPAKLEAGTTENSPDWTFAIIDATVFIDGGHPDVRKNGELVLTKPGGSDGTGFFARRFTVQSASVVSRSRFAVSGKATAVVVTDGTNFADFDGTDYRSTTAYTADDPLTLAEWPLASITGMQDLELLASVPDFGDRREVLIRGPRTGDPAQEVVERAVVESVVAGGGRSTLHLTAAIAGAFEPKETVVHANVVAATHGETVKQVLGSGDATQPFQRFPLGRAPLTYLHSGASPRGAESTLRVFVNDLRWKEAPSLYGAGPHARVYRIARDAEEKSAVRFGDGRDQGARLPSGSDNVRAEYRVGAGSAGNVRAKQLTLLMTQPFGVKDVINPQAAQGGVDPELLADVRRNAPRTVLTIDRVVSLRDYEAYAASFPGVGKAMATWTWLGTSREVFISVAGAKGERIEADSVVRTDLLRSLQRFGRGFVPIRIESFLPVQFGIVARFKVAVDAVTTIVAAAVRKALEDAFVFAARDFGQVVSLSEVESVIQNVSGVVFVDVDSLHRIGFAPPPSKRLVPARPKVRADGTLQAAEILTLAPWSQLDVRPMEGGA